MSFPSVRVPFVHRPAAIEPQQKLIWAMIPSSHATAMHVNVYSDVPSGPPVLFRSRPSQGDVEWTKEERDFNLAALLRLHRMEKKHDEAVGISMPVQDQEVKAEASAASVVVPQGKAKADRAKAAKPPTVKKPRAKRARSTKAKASTKKAKKAKTSSRSSKASGKAKGASKTVPVAANQKKRGRPSVKTTAVTKAKARTKCSAKTQRTSTEPKVEDINIDGADSGKSDDESDELKSVADVDHPRSSLIQVAPAAASKPELHLIPNRSDELQIPLQYTSIEKTSLERYHEGRARWPAHVKLQCDWPDKRGYVDVNSCCVTYGGRPHFC